ncbi:MAG: purine-nucleoside phosphorylase [Chloroflexi bacterium HGW-Chloroflexi-1]|nr:MAG: purine-nucleoside phosphorylase [Chloroflexi bacterium HGW-Chloroflexi-1]
MIDYEVFSRAQYQEAADAIRRRTAHRPQVGLILGSGLNPLADEVANADRISYADVPYFPGTSVAGHVGQLVIGELSGQTVLIMQGRTHAFEGVSLQRITLPVRVMHELGIHTLMVTNAAGGINPEFRAGDLMLIVDHLGLMAMTGGNPLWGPNDESLGPRFPAMSKAYTPALRRLALEVAARAGIPLRQGIYGGLSGPAFETPAEVRFLRLIGVDAVGMSTVPEVLVACHMGMHVLGFSGISNTAVADLDVEAEADHKEVLVAGQMLAPGLMALLRGILAALPAP